MSRGYINTLLKKIAGMKNIFPKKNLEKIFVFYFELKK
jgi:hypothetical protein